MNVLNTLSSTATCVPRVASRLNTTIEPSSRFLSIGSPGLHLRKISVPIKKKILKFKILSQLQ